MSDQLTQLLKKERQNVAEIREALKFFNEKVQRTEGPVVHIPVPSDNNSDAYDTLEKWAEEMNKRARAEWDARTSRQIIKKRYTGDPQIHLSLAAYTEQVQNDAKLAAELFDVVCKAEADLLEAMAEVEQIEELTDDVTITEPLEEELSELLGMRKGMPTAEMVVRYLVGESAINTELLRQITVLVGMRLSCLSAESFAGAIEDVQKQFAEKCISKVINAEVDPYTDDSGADVQKLAELLLAGEEHPEIEVLFDKAIAYWQKYVDDTVEVARSAAAIRYALDYADVCCELLRDNSSQEEHAEREEQVAIITQQWRQSLQSLLSYIGYCRMLEMILEELKADWQASRSSAG